MVAKRRVFLIAFVAMWLASGSAAYAADFRTGQGRQDISGTVEDDVYVAGESVSISGNVTGDTVAFARQVALTGTTGGSLMAGAETVTLRGVVTHSARVGARNVEVAGSVGGDVLAGTQSLVVTPSGIVGRDLWTGAQAVAINGRVGRNLRGGMASLTIGGTVDGNVNVEAEQVVVRRGARITGDLIYRSASDARIEEGAFVGGRVERRRPTNQERDAGPADLVLNFLQGLVGPLLLGLVLFWLVPGPLTALSRTIRTSPWLSLGIGLLGLILVPIAVIWLLIFAISVGGGASIPLALAGAYALILVLARLIVGFTLGSFILRINRDGLRPTFPKAFLALAVGVVVLALLSLVPILGPILAVVVAVVALGGAIVAFARWRSSEPPAAPPPPEPVPAPVPATSGDR